MQQKINSAQEEQSNTPSSTKEADKLSYLNEEIEEAKPLRIVGNNEKGYTITLGKWRVSEIKATEEEARALIKTNLFEIIINTTAAITNDILGEKDRYKNPL